MRYIKDIKENQVIHCKTREEYLEILKLTDRLGWKDNNWKNYYSAYDVNTCLSVAHRQYGPINYYINAGYTIIPASEFLNQVYEIY